jgi:hypothetical protein
MYSYSYGLEETKQQNQEELGAERIAGEKQKELGVFIHQIITPLLLGIQKTISTPLIPLICAIHCTLRLIYRRTTDGKLQNIKNDCSSADCSRLHPRQDKALTIYDYHQRRKDRH